MSDNYGNFSEEEKNLEELRRRKAAEFKLTINSGFDADSDAPEQETTSEQEEPSELNSYSGKEVRAQIARDSKHALKKKKRSEKKQRSAKNKHNRRIFRFIWIVSVLIVGGMAGLFLTTGINDMLAVNRTDSSAVVIDIPENPDIDTVADTLETNGIIDEPTYFKMFAELTKSADDFTRGTYEMRKNMDYEAIINYLLSNSNRTDVISVTVTEGENILEVADTLTECGVLGDSEEFLSLCNSSEFDDDYTFLSDIKNSDSRYYKLEGYLYPDTYNFYENEEPESIIYKFLNNYETKMNEKQAVDGYDKTISIQKIVDESSTGYSLDEIMNIASIIQAEAADTEDMYYISSVIHNRLSVSADYGVSNLSLDSTQFYPYRTADDVPSSLGSDYVSNYETYNHSGLPAGPICNPGMDAILAAVNPKSTDYLYFCHDDDGNAYYAETSYEHQLNLENYVYD